MPLPDGFSFRPATVDDADLWARLKSTDPRLAYDPLVERETWDEVPPGVVRERRMIQEGGIPIGRAALSRTPRAEGRGPQFVDVVAGFLDGHEAPELLAAAWDDLEGRARALEAEVITTHCLDHEAVRRAFLERRGYLVDRAGIFSGLEIGVERERFLAMARAAEVRMATAGIQLTTLDSVADRLPEVYGVMVESESDIPSTVPISHPSLEQFARGLDRPWTGHYRVWVALEGGRPVGISWLAYYPIAGNVFTEMTGVARAARGKGVATALKLKTIEQALAAGVDTVLTQNDAGNAAILKINRALGYQPLREQLLYRRPA
jgi:GNAT superfamily N-acetyltransferase